MLQKRRTVPLRRTLNLEALEDRTLLTGNVVATLIPATGTLNLQGDFGSNSVQILDSSPPGFPNLTLRVQGTPGTFTSINGVQHIDFDASSIQNVVFTSGGSTFSKYTLQILGALPQGNTIPGQVIMNAGPGQNVLTMSDITLNQVALLAGGTAGPTTATLVRVKAGLVNLNTSNGADTVSVLSSNVGTVNIQTGNAPGGNGAGDAVTISNTAGAASTIGSLTINSGVGSNSITVNNTSSSKMSVTNTGQANLNDGSDNPNLRSSVVNVSSNVVLTSLRVHSGQLVNGKWDNAANSTRQRVNVDNNTLSLGINGNAIDVVVGTGATQVFATGGNASRQGNFNTMSVSGNKLLNLGAIRVEAGDNLYTGNVNNNIVARSILTGPFAGLGMNVEIGNNSGYGADGGSNAPSSSQVTISNNTVPQGLLNVEVGVSDFSTARLPGTFTRALVMNADTAKFMSIGVGNTNRRNGNEFGFQGGDKRPSGNSTGEVGVTQLTNLTATGGPIGGVPALLPITIGRPGGGAVDNFTGRAIINGLNAPLQRISLAISNALGDNGGTREVSVQNVIADTLDGNPAAAQPSAIIGNSWPSILFNNITLADSNGDFVADLVVSIGNDASSTIQFSNINAAGNFSVSKIGTLGNPNLITWIMQNIACFNFFMAADGTGNDTNIALFNYDPNTFLPLATTIKVQNFLDIAFGPSFNGVAVHNTTCFFGFINGGGGGGSVFQGFSDPTNSGFSPFNFSGYF